MRAAVPVWKIGSTPKPIICAERSKRLPLWTQGLLPGQMLRPGYPRQFAGRVKARWRNSVAQIPP